MADPLNPDDFRIPPPNTPDAVDFKQHVVDAEDLAKDLDEIAGFLYHFQPSYTNYLPK